MPLLIVLWRLIRAAVLLFVFLLGLGLTLLGGLCAVAPEYPPQMFGVVSFLVLVSLGIGLLVASGRALWRMLMASVGGDSNN